MVEADFYQILDIRQLERGWLLTFSLNPNHAVFKGHFPGRPLLPGVCMVQIVKDVVCKLIGEPMFLAEAKQIKFLEMIIPKVNEVLEFKLNISEVDNNSRIVQASFEKEGRVCFKFQGNFQATERR